MTHSMHTVLSMMFLLRKLSVRILPRDKYLHNHIIDFVKKYEPKDK